MAVRVSAYCFIEYFCKTWDELAVRLQKNCIVIVVQPIIANKKVIA